MSEVESFLSDLFVNCKDKIITNIYTMEHKQLMRDQINTLSSNEMLYVFKICIDNDEAYTRNTNGVFFDLNTMNIETLDKIDEYLRMVKEKKNTSDDLMIVTY